MPGVVRVLSWNLQGAAGLDLEVVAGVVRAAAPDVFLVQEIQRAQSRRLADVCGFAGRRWAFKHWSVVVRPEGMAVLSHVPVSTSTTFVLRPAWPWSWRRRIALEATVIFDTRPIRLINVHLSPHAAHERRSEEIDRVILRRGVAPPIVAGDFNDRPGAPALRQLMAAGWRDAWVDVHAHVGADALESADDVVDVGATNWTGGDRRGRRPTQRLDMIFVPPQWSVRTCTVIDEPLAERAELTDHLPVVAELETP